MSVVRRSVAALLVGVTLLSVLACGRADPPAPVPEPAIDLAALDTGIYRTQIKDYAPAVPEFAARVREAQRIGAVMPLPSEIDRRLRVNRPDTVHAFLSPDETYPAPLHDWLPEQGITTTSWGLVGGFATTGQSETDYEISVALSTSALLFVSEAHAVAAAAALTRRGWSPAADGSAQRVETVRSSRHPEAGTSWLPRRQVLGSWLASGRFVVAAIAESPENRTLGVSDRDLLLDLTDNALTVTTARLAAFTPTPPAELHRIDQDPDGLHRIAVHRPPGDSFHNLPGVYDTAAWLHLVTEPERTRAAQERSGVDRVLAESGLLFRARDAAAARELLTYELTDKWLRPVDSPPGLPVAPCRRYIGPRRDMARFLCFVAVDRYVFETWAGQLTDAHQRVSAQYTLLVRAR